MSAATAADQGEEQESANERNREGADAAESAGVEAEHRSFRGKSLAAIRSLTLVAL
jgi:hypothetical protein